MALDHILLIDIDALRPDVFQAALAGGQLPNLGMLLGGPELTRGLLLPAVSTAPSITFCAQATLFTGTHPRVHGVPGNQFFDRFGEGPSGKARFYAFDVGDTLEIWDAVQVFTESLAGARLRVPTLYETLAEKGRAAVVAGNMYAVGAAAWLGPKLPNLGRFLKGGALFGMAPEAFDRHILNQLTDHLEKNGLPALMTLYFMGLDYTSHQQGPEGQLAYLVNHVDPLVGTLLTALRQGRPAALANCLVAIFSDHGQIAVPDDDQYALKLGFPFDREMATFFDAIGLDVHDYPNEAPNCNAVLALNGGLADIYLHHHAGTWQTPPDFTRDVLPVGQAFWAAHERGAYAPEMAGTLAAVLARDVAAAGWEAPLQALTPAGDLISLERWFAEQPADLFVDPVNRLRGLTGRYSGDLLLISNYAAGYYFGNQHRGVHGGLHPDDSRATLAFGWPGLAAAQWEEIARGIRVAIDERCQAEGGRKVSIADLLTGLNVVIDRYW